jgi:hypothetical protein
MKSNSLSTTIEYYFFPESYSETTKSDLKELFAPQIRELQEQILARSQRRKEVEIDVSQLLQPPIYKDGKQLFIKVYLFDRDNRFVFAAVIGPRDFYEAKGLSWPPSARYAGIDGPEPGVYLFKKSS